MHILNVHDHWHAFYICILCVRLHREVEQHFSVVNFWLRERCVDATLFAFYGSNVVHMWNESKLITNISHFVYKFLLPFFSKTLLYLSAKLSATTHIPPSVSHTHTLFSFRSVFGLVRHICASKYIPLASFSLGAIQCFLFLFIYTQYTHYCCYTFPPFRLSFFLSFLAFVHIFLFVVITRV